MGRLPEEGYSNSRLLDGVVLGPLTDMFAMPTWIPLANVFSVGDALIGVGAAIAIVAAMHGRGPRRRGPSTAVQRRAGLTADGRCVARTDPTVVRPTSTTGCMASGPMAPKRSAYGSDVRSVMDHRPGQTRREAGTQSQGSSSEDRPVAGVQHKYLDHEVVTREGEPGALHPGRVAPGDDGPVPRRRGQVGLVELSVNNVSATPTRTEATRPGPNAGHRWD